MSLVKTDVVVVGGGQAGIAASEHLTKAGIEHVVLERARTAENWRSMRWDSLVANGPAWHDRFPNMKFKNQHQDAFVPKEEVADYLVDYAKMFNAPIREGVNVESVKRKDKGGFVIETNDGVIEASYVISATGAFQNAMVPPIVPEIEEIKQIHSTAYRNPGALPEGNVIIIGAGSSGSQIAAELMKTNRSVFLSVGAHDRPPRRYRNRDFCWWLPSGGWIQLGPASQPRPPQSTRGCNPSWLDTDRQLGMHQSSDWWRSTRQSRRDGARFACWRW